jgi:adenylate cyclase
MDTLRHQTYSNALARLAFHGERVAQERVVRRLAAIFAADVVGYSRLVGMDEEGTIARLDVLREEIIDTSIAKYHGRIVKTTGDGVLAEFPSVVDAVRNAVEIQRALAEREAAVSEDRRIAFRVGVNLGDIVVKGDDILGDGVNVAVRLEGLAAPGGICISGDVFRQIDGKLDLDVEDMGERKVKNIRNPIRVYQVVTDGKGTSTVASELPELELPDKTSIAVLPFDNLSDDPDQEYFADGIAEDVLTALSRFNWLFVIARNSSFTYRGKAVNVKQVARELGVRYVLEGSVRKAGERVRIAIQLIDALSDNHVWAERYDRDLEDIFAVQDEIVERIVGNLEPELLLAETARAHDKRPGDMRARDKYYRALWHLYRFSRDEHAEAQRLFEQAIEMDPDHAADAWGLLAATHVTATILGFSGNPTQSIKAAVEAGQRSIALDDRSALGHSFLGISLIWARQHDRAMTELKRGIDLNPNSAVGHLMYANGVEFAGDAADALEHSRIAIRLSPLDPLMTFALSNQGLAHLLLRELHEAADLNDNAARINPGNIRALTRLACALAHLDRLDEARAAFAKALELKPDFDTAFVDATYPFRNPEDREYFLDGLRRAGLPD